jgi:hypothetical protein
VSPLLRVCCRFPLNTFFGKRERKSGRFSASSVEKFVTSDVCSWKLRAAVFFASHKS